MAARIAFLAALVCGLSLGTASAQLRADASVGSGDGADVGASVGGIDAGASIGGDDSDADGDGGGGFGGDVGASVGGSGGGGSDTGSSDGSSGSGGSDAGTSSASSGSDGGDAEAAAGETSTAATDPGGTVAAPSNTATPTVMSVDVNGDGSLTVEDLATLSDEQIALILSSLSKPQFRRLRAGCRHAGLDAELRGTCAYLSDYLR
jgi:hypothetical protein